MRAAFACIAVVCGLAVAACDKGGDKASQPVTGAASSAAPAAAPVAIDVPSEGKKFEPPIKPEQVPPGAWYCDMGTVHWAQLKEGDKTCPLCKMELKHKPAR